MIIGVTHLNEYPNHELVKLFDPTVLFQTVPLFQDSSPLDRVLDVLACLSDHVICYGSIDHEPLDKVEFREPLVEGSRNSPSIFHVARNHRQEMILYVPSHIICSDYESLKTDIREAIRIAETTNQFVVLTTERWSGADHNVGWCATNHYIAPLQGLERSKFLLGHAQGRAHELHDLRYQASTGICVFPSKKVFNAIKNTMPKYYEWIVNAEWSNVCDLTFEQAVLENVMNFQTLHTKTVTMPVNHFYQMYLYLLHAVNKGEPFSSAGWTVCAGNSEYEIAVRRVDSHQTNVDLLPGVYFKHGVTDIESLDEVVFVEKEKTYRKFERNIELMRIRKL